MVDIFTSKVIHLVGIKGVAMTALAQCLDDMGAHVSGSDVEENFVTQKILSTRHFFLETGFDPAHIKPEMELVIYTGAHQGKNNPEVKEAQRQRIPVLSHAEALGMLMHGKKGISVCGTGGKSTTSAMIAWILDSAGLRPSFAVGVGNIPNFGVSGRYTQIHSQATDEVSRSGWFVAEADEYAVDPTSDTRPRFIYQKPAIIVCPNLSYDHPDIYADFDSMKKVFLDFFNSLPKDGVLILNGDDPELLELSKNVRPDITQILVGTSEQCTMKISSVRTTKKLTTFTLQHTNKQLEFTLGVPGEHNVRNAALAIATAGVLQASLEKTREALAQFASTMRRFEYKGKLQQIPCFDDYAHTPEEITATIKALRDWEPERKIVVAFQPHTYSRTKALFDGFVDSLALADRVILLPIFASAREEDDPSIHSDMIAAEIAKRYPGKIVTLSTDIAELAESLQKSLTENDTFMTMGAGDIYTVYEKLELKP